MIKAIVGANWGDEGKGKMTDYLAGQSDIVIRFQGGSNAGHTIINEFGKFALHLLPSGVFYPNVTNILGPGVALNMEYFAKELDALIEKGIATPKILISDRAQVLLPWHILFDKYEEERLGKNQFGSTQSGIAPFYSDKYAKIGIQVADIFNDDVLREKINRACFIKNVTVENLYHKPAIKPEDVFESILKIRDRIKPFVCDTSLFLNKAISEGKNILLEGQLGALRDPDHGIYPFTTSSSTLAGFAPIGAGVPPHAITNIICIIKAYSSCVGAGPFTSEIFGDEAHELRERGGDCGEYGATTGRPRRMGWFDAVATKYGCMVQGATEATLTLVDVLGYLEEIPICTSYNVDGVETTDFPNTLKLNNATPNFIKMPGWKCDVSKIREFDKLPIEAQNYIKFIEDYIKVPIKWVSVGPKREDVIVR